MNSNYTSLPSNLERLLKSYYTIFNKLDSKRVVDEGVDELINRYWPEAKKVKDDINSIFNLPAREVKIVTDPKESAELLRKIYGSSFDKNQIYEKMLLEDYTVVVREDNKINIIIPKPYLFSIASLPYILAEDDDVLKGLEELSELDEKTLYDNIIQGTYDNMEREIKRSVVGTIVHGYLHEALKEALPFTQQNIVYVGLASEKIFYFVLNQEFFTKLFENLFMNKFYSPQNQDYRLLFYKPFASDYFKKSFFDIARRMASQGDVDEQTLRISLIFAPTFSYFSAKVIGESLWNKYGNKAIKVLTDRVKNNNKEEEEIMERLSKADPNKVEDHLFELTTLDSIIGEKVSEKTKKALYPITSFIDILTEFFDI